MIEKLQQAQKIFEHAVDMPADEQLEYVEQACQDDSELLKIVQELLNTNEQLNTRIDAQDQLNVQLQDDDTGETLSEEMLREDRQNLAFNANKYRLLRKIGEGGMGSVYLCEHTDPNIKQQVAVKVLRFNNDKKETVQRFEQERSILSQLKHPNITQFIDADYFKDGRPYVVMEYTPGQSIVDYCNSKGLGVQDRLNLFLDLCDATEYAHRHLIIHRDIKPSNVLVTEEGTLKLLDFGIAKALEGSDLETATGFKVLTPAYASPEHISGHSMSVSSDVYSLGVILYELLCGQRPHDWKSLSPSEYEQKILNTTATLPSQIVSENSREQAETIQKSYGIHAERLKRMLQNDLDLITLKAIQADTKLRYQTVDALVADITRYFNNEPIEARQPSFFYKTGKFIKRHRYAMSFTSITAGLLAALVISTLLQNRTIRQRSLELQEQSNIAVEQQERAEWVTQTLVQSFKNADPTNTLGDELKASDVLNQAKNQLLSERSGDAEINAQLGLTIAEVFNNMSEYQSAADILEAIEPYYAEFNDQQKSAFLNEKASTLYTASKTPEALTLLEEELPLVQNPAPEIVITYARILTYVRQLEKAEQVISDLFEQLPQESSAYLKACSVLANIYNTIEKSEQAIELLKSCIDLADARNRKDEIWDRAVLRNTLAITYVSTRNMKESTAYFYEELELVKKAFGDNHFALAKVYQNLAANYRIEENFEKSIEYHNKTIQMTIDKFGENNIRMASQWFNLGNLYFAKREYEKAEAYYLKAIPIQKRESDGTDYRTALFLQALGWLRAEAGKLDQSEAPFKESIELFEQVGGIYVYAAAETEVMLADVLNRQNKTAQAKALLAKALPNMYVMHPPTDEKRQLAEKMAAEFNMPIPEQPEPDAE